MRLALFRGLNSHGVFVPENWLQVSGGNFMIATVITAIKSTRARWVGDEKIVYEILIGKSKIRYSLGDVQ
jgi:hypothetical protein